MRSTNRTVFGGFPFGPGWRWPRDFYYGSGRVALAAGHGGVALARKPPILELVPRLGRCS
jgi:hypothetical protein